MYLPFSFSECSSVVHPVAKQFLKEKFGDYSGFPLSALSPALLVLKHEARLLFNLW